MNNALAVVPLRDLEGMAAHIVKSGMFGAKNEAQAMSLMLLAQAEGLHPMTAIQEFDVIQGRPARKTVSILSRFQQAGGKVEWEEITDTRACGVFSHPQGGSLRVEWTMEQARRAGLNGKDTWKNYPKAMLRSRAIAEGVRAVFPGAIGGMLSVEEAQDVAAAGAVAAGVQTAATRDMGQVEEVQGAPSAELVAIAEVAADGGVEQFRGYWKALSKADRQLLRDLLPVLQTRAENADATTIGQEPTQLERDLAASLA